MTFRYDIRDADRMDMVRDGVDRMVHGALFKMPTSVTMGLPCDGQPPTYELIALGSDAGRHDRPVVDRGAGAHALQHAQVTSR